MYSIEVQHTTHIAGIPAAEHDAEVARIRSLPFWRRLFNPIPTGELQIEAEWRDGSYPSREAAEVAARHLAMSLQGEIRDDSFVAIYSESDGEFVGGFYPSGDAG